MQEFFTYALRKDLNGLQTILETEIEVDLQDTLGETALIYACGSRRGVPPSLPIAEYLIEKGADVNAQSQRGYTPLSQACEYAALDVVQLLLNRDADPNLPGYSGQSPLVFAAIAKAAPALRVRIMEILLTHGAEINAVNHLQQNALHLCLTYPTYDPIVAKFLIDAGIDLEFVGRYEATALKIAVENGNLEMVRYLAEKGANLDARNSKGETALAVAIQKNQREVVEWLLGNGADPHAKTKYGVGLLSYAGEYNLPHLLSYLDDGRVEWQSDEKLLKSALGKAAWKGSLEFFRSLVERGIRLDLDFQGNETPLIKAAHYGFVDLVTFLLENGASPEERTRAQNTALHLAAGAGKIEVLKILVNRHADIHAKNEKGQTPLFAACAEGRVACAEFLIEKGAAINLLEAEQGTSPLIAAVAKGSEEVVQILIEAGANVNIQAKNGKTALSWAKGKGFKGIRELLEKANAKMPPPPRFSSKEACALCNASLTLVQQKENHCPKCDLAYCNTHYPWGRWEPTDFYGDIQVRQVICPYGHSKEERGRGR